MDHADWMNESKPIETLDVWIGFLLNDSFYTGDPNDRAELRDPAYRQPLVLPDFLPASEREAASTAVAGHELALATYYKRLVEQAVQYNKGFDETSSCFWMRLALWNAQENVRISFPWYDTLSEMQTFIEWLEGAPDSDTFCDVEQGWQLDGYLLDGHVYLCETDPDSPDDKTTRVNVVTPRAALRDAAKQVERQTTQIINCLTAELGTDVWTHYSRDVRFGTATWQPGYVPARAPAPAPVPETLMTGLAQWFRR
jgi:hypothetical protein